MPKSKAQELALFAQYLNSNGQLNAITMSVDGLTDVDTTTNVPTNGQSLVWDGANFVPGAGGGGGSNTNAITEGNDNSVGESTPGAADGTNNLYFTNERVDDRVNQLLVAGTNIGFSYDDANNTFTINSDNTGGYNLANNTTDNLSEGSTNLYYTDARVDAKIASNTGGNLDLSSKSTTDLTEGTNLYYTDARADARIALQAGANLDLSSKSTSDLSEGTNLYYTDARADARVATATGANLSLASKTTDDLSQGSTNLYFTNTRADARISAASITDLSDADQTVRTTDNVTFNNITTTGYIAGPASFTIDPAAVGDNTGTVIIAGNLQVDGTTTTINSTTLDVDDLNITVAKGAANAGAANGAGLTVDGASATLTYVNPGDNWAFNKPLDMGSNNITTTGKILYSNIYSAEGDLPNASTYHGMFAHVHGTGKGYFAHAGNWIKLLDETSSTTTNLSEGTNLYYTDARVDTHLNQGSAGSNEILSWNGSDYAWVAQTTGYGDSNVDTHLNTSTASTNEVLSWNGSDYDWVAQSGGISLSSLSVGAEATAAGDGAIAYNNSNGVFTYTPPVLSGLSGDTDDISEGSSNQYFTSARVQAENLGGSLAGTISDTKMQYATSYSGTPAQGSFFFDSLNAKVKVYNGSAFVDAVPASGGGGGGSGTDANTTFRKYIYTTTSATNSVSGKDDVVVTAGNFVEGYQYEIISVGTTDFTAIGASANTVGVTFTATGTGSGTGTAGHILNYATNGTENVEVYVNGIKQVEGSSYDYVATTGTSVNFVSNFASGDVVDIQVYELLTNDAYYTKTQTYTQAEVNSQITTAVGGNLTLTGLTVDTDTLKVDTSNNKVGIGTDTPSDRLEIDIAADNTGITLTDNGDSYTGKISFDSNELAKFSPLGIISAAWNGTEVANIRLNGADSNTTKNDGEISFHTKASSGSLVEAMRIDESGNVGIGTTNPGQALHVQQTIDGTGGGIQVRNSADASGMFMYVDASNHGHVDMGSAGDLRFKTGSANRALIRQAGNVEIGINPSTNTSSKLTVLNDIRVVTQVSSPNNTDGGAIRLGATGETNNQAQTKIQAHRGASSTTGDLSFSVSDGTGMEEVMRITSNKRVGVGTNNPLAALHVDDGAQGAGPILMLEGGGASEGDLVVPSDQHFQLGHWDNSTSTLGLRMEIEDGGSFGFNQLADTNSVFRFKAAKTMDTSMSANKIGMYLDIDYDGTIDANGDRAMYGFFMDFDHNVAGGNTTDNEQIVYGGRIDLDYSGNDTNDVFGFQVQVDNNASNTNATTQIAGDFQSIADNAAGDISSMYGIRGLVHTDNNSGVEAVHDGYGIYTKVYNSSDGGKFSGTVAAGYFEIEHANLATSSHESNLVGENAFVVRAEYDNNTSNAGVVGGYTALFYGNYAGTMPSGTNYGIYLPDTNTTNVIGGSLSKGSGSFRIPHPKPELTETKDLVHSFVEGPQADNLYRGRVTLVDGSATVNIDTVSGMTEGTFVLLNRDIQCFTSNETGWTNVRGSVSGNTLTIQAQDNTCTDTISWMVVGERQDQHMYDTDWTDEEGRVIVEPDRVIPPHEQYPTEDE